MLTVGTWWRHLGRALAALTLGLFVLAPSLDALVCYGDGTPSHAVAEGAADHLSNLDDGGAGRPDSAPDQPCVHGHCHHDLQSVPVALADGSVIEGRPERPVWPASVRLATLTPSGPDRPPRA